MPNEINYTHNNENELSLFARDNIELINNRISEFSKKKHDDLLFDSTDIKRFLKEKFIIENESFENQQRLLNSFEEYNYVKSRIKDIAIENTYYHTDLQKFYEQYAYKELSANNDLNLCKTIINALLEEQDFSEAKKGYYYSTIFETMEKALYMALHGGYDNNINNVEEGIMTANAGDSAQFLFLARAILAGYNCSNVDVRSSRYDAIIDYKGKLFKVQVKGISGNTISFKDRDRGGRGIDTTNPRNIGRRITSRDCDIYVAVDKQIGLCYIIPMNIVDEWDRDSITVREVENYKENWNIIDTLIE